MVQIHPFLGHMWEGLSVGILGGSFNPAHDGHRHISLHALKSMKLDAVWWMVSPQNPLKSTKDMAPLAERMKGAMDVANHPKIHVTDVETSLNTRYTADTLDRLKTLCPKTKFVWLMGTDNLHQINRWQRWQDIFNLMPVCVLDRPPRHNSLKSCAAMERFRTNLVPQEKAPLLTKMDLPAWTILHIPLNDMSATAIRAQKLINQQKNDRVDT